MPDQQDKLIPLIVFFMLFSIVPVVALGGECLPSQESEGLYGGCVISASEEPPPSRSYSTNVVGEWMPREGKEEPALSINEPMYFVVGKDDGETIARFQFSFKYLMFDADSTVVKNVSWLRNFNFAYTQASLWNLSADSKPFEDTNYRPSFFWEFLRDRGGLSPVFLRTGYEHESNGQGGEESRSIDTLFFFPAWATLIKNHQLIIGTKLYCYLDQERNNRNIENYRGYADLLLRYGNEDGWLANMLYRHGIENKNTLQLDLSYPIRKKFLGRGGGYFYLQAFHGYGESLLTYDQKQDLQLRLGFAIVR